MPYAVNAAGVRKPSPLTGTPPAASECHKTWACIPRSAPGGSPRWGGPAPLPRSPASCRRANRRPRRRRRRKPSSCWAGCDCGRPSCGRRRGLRWPWLPWRGSLGCRAALRRCCCCCCHCRCRSWKWKALVVVGWWWTWMAAARATYAQASSRSPSGRTRHIPGCTCQSWLRQAKAGRLDEAREEKDNINDIVCFPQSGNIKLSFLSKFSWR